MERSNWAGHLSALATILIWGTTFISTKVLLGAFRPVEILFFRFAIGFLALLLACPRRLRGTSPQEEAAFAGAGLCGVCLYYLLENLALTLTSASNVGVIISAAPFFTAALSRLIDRKTRLGWRFPAGFVLAAGGLWLLHAQGKTLKFHGAGDFLALAAALVWACYSVLTRRIAAFGYPTVQTTRRIFGYGILFMLPALFASGFRPVPAELARPVNVGNLLFLGLGASALCFVTWNYAVKVLGAVRTSVYIYIVPVVTVVTAALVLGEPVTPLTAAGTLLTLAGLALSNAPGRKKGTAEKI